MGALHPGATAYDAWVYMVCILLWNYVWKVGIWLKVGLTVLFDGVLLPQAVGWYIGILTLRVFNTTLKARLETCLELPVLCVLFHWSAGMLLVIHINTITLELSDLLCKGALGTFLPDLPMDRELGHRARDDDPRGGNGNEEGGVGVGAIGQFPMGVGNMNRNGGPQGDDNNPRRPGLRARELGLRGLGRRVEGGRVGLGIDLEALDFAMQAPALTLLKRCIISIIILAPAVVLLVLVPSRFGHILTPGCGGPLFFRFDDMMVTVQLPLEMLLYHVVIPFYSNASAQGQCEVVLKTFLMTFCRLLALEDLLSDGLKEELRRSRKTLILSGN